MIHSETNACREQIFVIAEAGVNHNGNRDIAFELVNVAARAGANAVKFQTFDAARLASSNAPKAAYQLETTAVEESQLVMLQRLELPLDWHRELKDHAEALGVEFMSTPFDAESLVFLSGLDVRRLKVPSGELTNAPFLWQFGRAGLPIILSTGMATISEVETALAILAHALAHAEEPDSLDDVWRAWSRPENRRRVQEKVTLLHCTSQYPSVAGEINLLAMNRMSELFGLAVGYSDHSMGTVVPIAAAARGATIIEKHFTLDREMEGPDHRASLLPDELATMVAAIREVEQSLGSGEKVPQPSEWDTRDVARQTIVAARPIAAGQMLTREDLSTARCGSGLLPTRLWDLVGTRAPRDLKSGDVFVP